MGRFDAVIPGYRTSGRSFAEQAYIMMKQGIGAVIVDQEWVGFTGEGKGRVHDLKTATLVARPVGPNPDGRRLSCRPNDQPGGQRPDMQWIFLLMLVWLYNGGCPICW